MKGRLRGDPFQPSSFLLFWGYDSPQNNKTELCDFIFAQFLYFLQRKAGILRNLFQ